MCARVGRGLVLGGSGSRGGGFLCNRLMGTFLFFLQVLLHPNSGAAGKDGEIETLRLAQYKAFYTTGTVSLLEIVKSGRKLLEFLVPCRYS